jgi:hypothetical protein
MPARLTCALKEMINRFFDQVTGRTRFTAVLSIRVHARFAPIDAIPVQVTGDEWKEQLASRLDAALQKINSIHFQLRKNGVVVHCPVIEQM